MNKNRYSFVPRTARKQGVGVDLRLVIISSLVVAMLLIQVILVETYSTKKPRPIQVPLIVSLSSAPAVSSDDASDTAEAFENDEKFKTESPSVIMITGEEEIEVTKRPTSPAEHVDIQQLEEQLRELQDIQTNEEDTFSGITKATSHAEPPQGDPIPITVSQLKGEQTNSTLSPEAREPEVPPLPNSLSTPIIQTGSLSTSSLGSRESSHHHSIHRSSSSSSTSHLSKSCRARRHLFRSYKTPPRIVCFMHTHHDKGEMLDPLWRQVFMDLGYQETLNPNLATFMMSRQSSENKVKEVRDQCIDSQVFNHLKNTRSLTHQISLSRSVQKHSHAQRSFPEISFFGGYSSSTSYSTKKAACASFMGKAVEYFKALNFEKNFFVLAFFEKHDSKLVNKVSLAGLKKAVDAYKKQGSCPHSDDSLAIQAFRNVLLLDEGRTLCSLKVFVYLPSARPLMAFLSARQIFVHCTSAGRGELLLMGSNETDSTRHVFTLGEFKNRLLHEGRFTSAQNAAVAFQELLFKIKRAVGELIVSARSKMEARLGRFGLLSADFVLDAFSLQPILVRFSDIPSLTPYERVQPGSMHNLLVEVLQSQHYIIQRSWSGTKDTLRPEDLRSLREFELCLYETPLTVGKDESKSDASSLQESALAWDLKVYPFI